MSKQLDCVVQTNSLDYVNELFTRLNAGKAVVNLGSQAPLTDLQGFELSKAYRCAKNWGWYKGERYLPSSSSEIAQILFSSGTEGNPKPIAISHSALANTTRRLEQVMRLNGEIREYIGVPVCYSFGFGRCRAICNAGGEFFLPENGFSPSEIAAMLKKQEINAVSAVPTLWRVVLEAPDLFEDCGNSMRWIEIGSQYMSAEEKIRLKSIFPNARIIQHYGLTEASRTTFLDIGETPEEQLESVGIATDDIEIRLDACGRIQIRGPHLATGTIQNGQIESLTDNEGWFTTNDLGRLEERFLWFEGRNDDLINCGGIKVSPEFIERELYRSLESESGIYVIRVPDKVLGDRIGIAIHESVTIDLPQLKSTLRGLLLEKGIRIGNQVPLVKLSEFPLTQTGKLRRGKLNSICQNQLADPCDLELSSPEEFASVSAHEPDQFEFSFEYANELKKNIRSIWEEALGISPISVNDSFFDLGGDSLTAIRVIMNMEQRGIPSEVCRLIFQGLTIKQIVDAVAASNENQESALKKEAENLQDRLIRIWKEALGVNVVSSKDSFFDLGGDSLSAMRVIVQMGKVGLPRDICQGVLHGHTIMDLCRGVHTSPEINDASIKEPAHTDADREPKVVDENRRRPTSISRTQIAAASLSLNVVRGFLVLINIGAHWMPGVVERLPDSIASLNRYLAPLYSSGTPGFAIVFGSGIGFFALPRFKKNSASITPLTRRNTTLLAGGIFILAVAKILRASSEQTSIDGMYLSNSFYSVLTFYLLAVVTLPFWMKLTASKGDFGLNCLFAAALLYLAHIAFCDVWHVAPSQSPFLQPGVLVLTAKYNYPEMMFGVLLGAASGYWFGQWIASSSGKTVFSSLGVLLILWSFLISVETDSLNQWFVWPKDLHLFSWLFYLGITLVLLHAVFVYICQFDVDSHRFFGFGLRVTSVIGILAFPFFIGHEIVIPLSVALHNLGVPGSLFWTMLTFFCSSIYAIRYVYSLYFGFEQKKLSTPSRKL